MSNSIENLIDGALKNIKNMIDVNTIIGDPIHAGNDTTIIPISKVSFGFGAGGTEFSNSNPKAADPNFGGGVGGGVSVCPVGFLVVTNDNVRMINVDQSNTPISKLIDLAPGALDKILNKFSKNPQNPDDEIS